MKKFVGVFLVVFLSFLLSLFLFKIWHFDGISIEQILFHIYAPIQGAPTDLLTLYLPCFSFCICLIGSILFLQIKYTKTIWISCLFLFGIDMFLFEEIFGSYFLNQFIYSEFIEKNYVDPKTTKISFPERRKNLIFILAESLETTFQDIPNGGAFSKNYTPNLSDLAIKNLNFSHSQKLEGAEVFSNSGWTIAGMVAQTAGIPLKTYGNSFDDGGNQMDHVVSFLPKVWTLGDVLSQNGYHNVFIAGSDTTFAGKNLYMSQHGNYEIYDKPAMEKELNKEFKIVHDRIIADSELFPIARKKIENLAKNSEPFHVLLLTGDTHMLGYLGEDCKTYSSGNENKIGKAYECADKRISDLVKWIMKQPFGKDTVIVITGDHCNMLSFDAILDDTTDTEDYKLYDENQRKVFNIFINSDTQAVKKTDRKFSTLDMYPTILASLGVKIEGDKLGLGTNLFSDKTTLLEKYTYDYLNQEFKKKSDFYIRRLWRYSH